MVYNKNNKFVLRNIHNSFFFIDITDNYADEKLLLTETNEIGAFIWNNLDGTNTVEDIALKLLEAIIDEIPYNVIFNDVNSCLLELSEKGIVCKESLL